MQPQKLTAAMLVILMGSAGAIAPSAYASEQPIISVFDGAIGGINCSGTITVTEETGSAGELVDVTWGVRILRSVIQRLTGIGEDFAYKDYGSPYDWQYECTASTLYVGATGVRGENRQVVVVGKTDDGEPVEATCTYSGAHSYDDRCTAVVEYPVRGVLDADYGHYESGQGDAPQYITFCVHPDARAINTAQEDGLAVVGDSLGLKLPGAPPSHEVTFSSVKPEGVCAQKAYIQWEFNDALDLS